MSLQPFERKRGITAKRTNYTCTLQRGKRIQQSHSVYRGTGLPFAVAGIRNISQRWIWFRHRRQTPTVLHCNTSKDEWWQTTGSQTLCKNAKWKNKKPEPVMISICGNSNMEQSALLHKFNWLSSWTQTTSFLFFFFSPSARRWACRPPPIWPSVFPVDDGLSLAWSIL